jgi:hypothetical protein
MWRLSEDVLSDGAARCIAQLPESDRAWGNREFKEFDGAKKYSGEYQDLVQRIT